VSPAIIPQGQKYMSGQGDSSLRQNLRQGRYLLFVKILDCRLSRRQLNSWYVQNFIFICLGAPFPPLFIQCSSRWDEILQGTAWMLVWCTLHCWSVAAKLFLVLHGLHSKYLLSHLIRCCVHPFWSSIPKYSYTSKHESPWLSKSRSKYML
jgi:hypothetical protein